MKLPMCLMLLGFAVSAPSQTFKKSRNDVGTENVAPRQMLDRLLSELNRREYQREAKGVNPEEKSNAFWMTHLDQNAQNAPLDAVVPLERETESSGYSGEYDTNSSAPSSTPPQSSAPTSTNDVASPSTVSVTDSSAFPPNITGSTPSASTDTSASSASSNPSDSTPHFTTDTSDVTTTPGDTTNASSDSTSQAPSTSDEVSSTASSGSSTVSSSTDSSFTSTNVTSLTTTTKPTTSALVTTSTSSEGPTKSSGVTLPTTTTKSTTGAIVTPPGSTTVITTNKTPTTRDPYGSLTGGQIAGIAMAGVFGVAILSSIVAVLYIKKKLCFAK